MEYEETAELVRKIQTGDEAAFQQLSEQFYPKAYYVALKISGNDADAKDIVQETFLQVHKSIHTLQDPKSFVKWFHRIIISKASNLFGKNKIKAVSESQYTTTLKEERRYMLPEKEMHFSSDQEMLYHFFAELDEKYRIVLVLHYFSHLKIKEIAQILQIPEGTVKSRMNVATKTLKQQIESYQLKEGIPLNFQSIDMAFLLSGFFQWDASVHTPVPTMGKQKVSFTDAKHLLSFLQAAAVVGTMSAIGVSAVWIHDTQSSKKPTTGSLVQEQRIDSSFSPVYYKGVYYQNAHDAYYALVSNLHCKAQMEKATLEELQEIKPLYEAIKDEDGVYWKMLQYEKWNQYYEEKINL